MIPALKTNHIDFRRMSTLLNFVVGIPGNGDARTQSDTFVGAVKRQCAELPHCPQMSCFAVAPNGATIGSPARETPRADHSGGRDGRTIPWHTGVLNISPRPAGLVEGNRGVPSSRRENGPTVGKAGGDACSPPPA